MDFTRSAGIILHPTSLSGPYGIGDLGKTAYEFIDFLAAAEIGLWEVLPLGPTGYGESPYQCFSAFAGNPLLISPEVLIQDNLLSAGILEKAPKFRNKKVDFSRVTRWKEQLLFLAFKQFTDRTPDDKIVGEFELFCQDESDWLDDYALFSAIKIDHQKVSWNEWSLNLRMNHEDAIEKYKKHNSHKVRRQAFIQFLFFKQWRAILAYAHKKGIKIIGDIPLFVAFDSADVWAHPELFDLNVKRKPRTVAGVPPDYFSQTGQLWGNPHYRWAQHKKTGYEWWKSRFKKTLELVDVLRVDHFRGFGGFWEVRAGEPTAQNGRWVQGPGSTFFKEIQKSLGVLPIIAEDLGVITQDVNEMLNDLNYPGMRILQFGFGSDANDAFLPHNYCKNCVAYTGTHDNATARGWYLDAPDNEKEFARKYLNSSGKNIAWNMLKAVWASRADLALAPMQDFLNLGNEARMNFPGKLGGNWDWRMPANVLTDKLTDKIKELNNTYGRNSTNLHPKEKYAIIHYEKAGR